MATRNVSTKKERESAEQAAKKRHEQRKSWFLAEAQRQAINRALMSKCESYYDSEQWTSDDAEELRQRGQNPIVYNEVKPAIDWMIGTERRSRTDFLVVAEDDGEDADDDARNKTKLLKYLDDCNRAEFERSYASESMFKAGVGWLEVGIRGDKSGCMVYVGSEAWRNILYDSQATKRDLSDARYIFRVKVVDLDIALAMFPDKEVELRAVVQTGDQSQMFSNWLSSVGLIPGLDSFGGIADTMDYLSPRSVDLFNPRERVLLLECWSREPYRQPLAEGGSLADPMTFKIRVAVMTESDTLIESWSPFNHDRFPFIPLWAYRNSRTGMPYSPIFPWLGPQEALNHRMSKSLYEASKNQLWMESDAVDDEAMDIEEIREELDDPRGIAVFAPGALSNNKVRPADDRGMAQKQLEQADREIQTIRQTSGANEENRGLSSQATSRVAMDAKAERGSVQTAELFDNILMARQLEGEMTLSLAEQFMTQPRTIRIAGDNGKHERMKINEPQADGSYKNDITARRAHFVVGEQAWKQSYAEAAFDSLMEVMTQLAAAAPQVVIALLDVVFDMHPNMPRKRQVLQRIRAVNGQTDPDAKMTPEQQRQQQQQAAKAQAQYEADMAMLRATVLEAQNKGEKLAAETMNTLITTVYESAQAAQVALSTPGAMVVADQLLESVGFKDQSGQGTGVVMPAQQAATVPPQMAPDTSQPDLQEPLQGDGAAVGSQPPIADAGAAPIQGV